MLPSVSPSKTTCGSLLQELQIIWDEIGECDGERDKMLLELEQECLEIYRRKVEKTRKNRADLHQTLANSEAEIANLISSLGEHAHFSRGKGTLRQQVSAMQPILDDLRSKKEQRVQEFRETMSQITRLSAEFSGEDCSVFNKDRCISENDLTAKKLGELKSQLQDLQNEKAFRQHKANTLISSVYDLSGVMSFDFHKTISDVHHSFRDSTKAQSKSISNETLARLTALLQSLRDEKHQRLHKLQDIGKKLQDLWNLMDTPIDEQQRFDHVTSLITSSIDEVSGKGCLREDVVEQAGAEVERLNDLKASKMRELVLKKQTELEAIYRAVHMDVDADATREDLISVIDSGNVELSELLASFDDTIEKAKCEALSRKDILDRVDKWRHALEEEKWLDEYEKDENRYSAVRGAHKNLKRAEKARGLVSKLPSMIDNLTVKIKAWEQKHDVPFLYDKSPLLHSIEEYVSLRAQREEEKRLSREQKKLQGQIATEQEALFGSKSAKKKPLGQSLNSDNIGARTPMSRRVGSATAHHAISGGKDRRESARVNTVIPLNYVALQKDD